MIKIKLFIDFVCPFCYIGIAIADKIRQENPEVEFEYYPYELRPNAPIEGYSFEEYASIKEIEKSFERIENLGSEYGLIFKNKINKSNSNRIHKAAFYSVKEGKFFEFAKEAYKAQFEDNKNIAEKVVINEIGLLVGLNIVEMNRCIDEGNFSEKMEEAKNLAKVLKVESVPTFILEDGTQVTELKEYEKFKKDLIG